MSSRATGFSSTATGEASNASALNSSAYGEGAQATGNQSTAIGQGAIASGVNSAAFGSGVVVSKANQQSFGTATNTYTLAGLGTGGAANGTAAQTGATQLVTTDSAGNLGTTTPATLGLATNAQVAALTTGQANLQSQIDGLGQQDKKLASGIAISLALAQPVLQSGQVFALRAGYGTFEGSNAGGISASGLLARNFAGRGSSAVLDGGIGFGTNNGEVAGRAGVTIGF